MHASSLPGYFHQLDLSQLIISSFEPWAQSMIALSINACMIYFDGASNDKCFACVCAIAWTCASRLTHTHIYFFNIYIYFFSLLQIVLPRPEEMRTLGASTFLLWCVQPPRRIHSDSVKGEGSKSPTDTRTSVFSSSDWKQHFLN